MKRGLLLAAALGALLTVAACQTWQDRAEAEALAECARVADPVQRKTCQTEVMTAAGDAERRQLEAQREAGLAREKQEALRKANGLPDHKDR